MRLLLTGAAGFIGSHATRHFVTTYPEIDVVCIDLLTYASDYSRIADLEQYKNFFFEKIDITDLTAIRQLFARYGITDVLHFAAESHVDNSIENPLIFAQTNVIGTLNLLEAARTSWQAGNDHLFYHISTDEVFGSLEVSSSAFDEKSPYAPRSPYSASKASSDHFVWAYYHTYNLPIIISHCSNNYGPGQHHEKLIPTVISAIVNERSIPIYGDGSNIRDWLFVADHIKAIELLFFARNKGNSYGIGASNEWSNLNLIRKIIQLTDTKLEKPKGFSERLIQFVADRKGHDFRYAIDYSKINIEIGWSPVTSMNDGLSKTIDWYLEALK